MENWGSGGKGGITCRGEGRDEKKKKIVTIGGGEGNVGENGDWGTE